MAEIEDIDLSEFGLDLDISSDGAVEATGSSATLSDDELPADVLAELGMADLDPPAAATNGQARILVAASDPLAEFLGEAPEPPAGSSVTSSPQHTLQQMPTLPADLTPQNATPSSGLGILEQILIEMNRLNQEIASLRQLLSNPGGSGPSMLSSTQGAQRSQPAASSASGTESSTAGAASRPRRSRGRPKKEEDEFNIE